jgi:hypothetical protein
LRDGRIASVNEPEALTTGRRQYLIVAGLLGDLAQEVFTALGVPTDNLDMWVAACCMRHQLPLVTLSDKDFVDFRQDGLELVEPPD